MESELGRSIRAGHSQLAAIDSMIWVEPRPGGQRLLVRSDAALRTARYLGGPWRLAVVGYIVPRMMRDALYNFIARHRHRLTRGGEHCYVPPPAIRARFLDQNG